MACKSVCRLCPNLVLSTAVAFDPITNSLDITIPNGVYGNGRKVCIVVAQAIPDSTTINALVNIIVNGIRFPLQKCNCVQATACEIKSRTKYSTCVATNTVSGVFRLLGRIYATCPDNLLVLPTDTTTTPAVANANVQVAAFTPSVATKTTSTKTTKKEVVSNE